MKDFLLENISFEEIVLQVNNLRNMQINYWRII